MGNNDLLSDLVTTQFAELRESGNELLQLWQQRALTAEAELEVVREQVMSLLRGDYMPTPAAIERALYARTRAIEARMLPDAF